MLAEIRKEIVPIIIVLDLLIVWSILTLTGDTMPPAVDTLVTAVVVFYFGNRSGSAAAARALNGYYNAGQTPGTGGPGDGTSSNG